MELFVAVVFVSVIFAIVGYFIDGSSGALWGFFLGPIGWIIAAILKTKPDNGHSIIRSAESGIPGSYPKLPESQKTGSYPKLPGSQKKEALETDEQRKWKVLKEVDPEIRAASETVMQLDPSLDAVMAEKYLVLNDKQYLQSLTDLVVRSHLKEKSELQALGAQYSEDVFQSGHQQKLDYEDNLGVHRIDPVTGMKVKNVEIYDGSWISWKGGIRVTLYNGVNILIHKSLRREFSQGDERWM